MTTAVFRRERKADQGPHRSVRAQLLLPARTARHHVLGLYVDRLCYRRTARETTPSG